MGYTIWEIFPKVRDPTSQQFHAALLGRGFVEVRPSLVLAIIDQSMFCIPILCGIEEEVVTSNSVWSVLGDSSNPFGFVQKCGTKIRRFIIIIQVSRFHSGFECHTWCTSPRPRDWNSTIDGVHNLGYPPFQTPLVEGYSFKKSFSPFSEYDFNFNMA